MKKLSYLIVLLIFAAACNNTTPEQSSTEVTNVDENIIAVAVFKVSGMHCESCEKTITNVLNEMDGVIDAKASVDHELAKAKFDPAIANVEDLKAAIEGKGYSVDEDIEIIKIDKTTGKPVE